MKYKFDYSEEKDKILKATREIGFEEIIQTIEAGNLVADKLNPNQKRYPGQRLLLVKLKKYIYVVPCVIDREREAYFLKTLYPSRRFTKQYVKNYKKKNV